MTNEIVQQAKIAIFRGKQVRKTIYNNEWWFVVSDVIKVLTDTKDATDYLKKMRSRDKSLSEGWGQIVTPLDIETKGGKQKLNCANTEGIFRIIQSIPSPKAEPFKFWLARVGYERIQEIEDPELAIKRMRALYKAKGYPDEWIERRLRGVAIREELTDEWKKRGAENKDYGILTNEISKATFGITPDQYKKHKGVKRGNLRDHMTDLELIFSMLGEKSTTEITRSKNSKGFWELRADAIDGGNIAGDARKKLELKTGRNVVSKENYLDIVKRKELKDKN